MFLSFHRSLWRMLTTLAVTSHTSLLFLFRNRSETRQKALLVMGGNLYLWKCRSDNLPRPLPFLALRCNDVTTIQGERLIQFHRFREPEPRRGYFLVNHINWDSKMALCWRLPWSHRHRRCLDQPWVLERRVPWSIVSILEWEKGGKETREITSDPNLTKAVNRWLAWMTMY